jgi:hypothetical protein
VVSGYTEVYRRFPKDQVSGTGPMSWVQVRGTGLSGDNPFSTFDSDSAPNSGRTPVPILEVHLPVPNSALLPHLFRNSDVRTASEAKRATGTRHQGTGVSRPISLVSTE